MKIRTIKAYAIVTKKRPRINLLDIYSKDDIEEIEISKDEELVEIEISVK